jgi:hypothetical protein
VVHGIELRPLRRDIDRLTGVERARHDVLDQIGRERLSQQRAPEARIQAEHRPRERVLRQRLEQRAIGQRRRRKAVVRHIDRRHGEAIVRDVERADAQAIG